MGELLSEETPYMGFPLLDLDTIKASKEKYDELEAKKKIAWILELDAAAYLKETFISPRLGKYIGYTGKIIDKEKDDFRDEAITFWANEKLPRYHIRLIDNVNDTDYVYTITVNSTFEDILVEHRKRVDEQVTGNFLFVKYQLPSCTLIYRVRKCDFAGRYVLRNLNKGDYFLIVK